jgi:general L-amino acid transport system substrate-binding protein
MRLLLLALALIWHGAAAWADEGLRCAVQSDIDTTAAAEACRAIAHDLLGPGAPVRLLETDTPDDVRADVVFATGQNGVPAFTERVLVMVPLAAPIHDLSGLHSRMICLMIGGDGQHALEALVRDRNMTLARLSFREDVEMRDAYNVGRCDAVVDTEARLNAMRQDTGVNRLRSRFLPEPVGSVTVFARTLVPRVAGVLASHGDIVQQPH